LDYHYYFSKFLFVKTADTSRSTPFLKISKRSANIYYYSRLMTMVTGLAARTKLISDDSPASAIVNQISRTKKTISRAAIIMMFPTSSKMQFKVIATVLLFSVAQTMAASLQARHKSTCTLAFMILR
jgi:hypothetical protein